MIIFFELKKKMKYHDLFFLGTCNENKRSKGGKAIIHFLICTQLIHDDEFKGRVKKIIHDPLDCSSVLVSILVIIWLQ